MCHSEHNHTCEHIWSLLASGMSEEQILDISSDDAPSEPAALRDFFKVSPIPSSLTTLKSDQLEQADGDTSQRESTSGTQPNGIRRSSKPANARSRKLARLEVGALYPDQDSFKQAAADAFFQEFDELIVDEGSASRKKWMTVQCKNLELAMPGEKVGQVWKGCEVRAEAKFEPLLKAW